MNSDQSDSGSVASSNKADSRSLFILILAAIIGMGLGCLTAADWFGNDHLPSTAVARVNDTDIQLLEYRRALRLFASEKRDPLRDHDRRLVLERMVEEELLVQHGVASGLVRSDRGVRTAVIQSMLTGLLVDVEAGAREVVSKNSATGMINATTAGETAGATDTTPDTELHDYLGQLREVATIRWMDGEPGR